MPSLPLILAVLTLSVDGAQWDSAELVPVAVPEPTARAMEFYWSGVWLWGLIQVWRIVVPAVLLFSGFSARMRSFAQKIGKSWFGTISVYVVLYLLLMYVIDLPLDFYLGYIRTHEYQLSEQTLGRWFRQEWMSLIVSMVSAVLIVWGPFLLLKRSPKRWWIYLGALLLPFSLFTAMIMPVWIDPLFNRFGPMNNQELEAKILALADRAGVDGGRVFEVDKSRDTKTVNAYVTGLLGTKRIVLWDTLLAKHDDKEVLAIMGHEMGHYVLNHVALGVSLATVGGFFLLFLVDRVSRRLISRFSLRFGFDSLADVASIPLLVLLLGVFNLVGAPIQHGFSRYMEHEADRFALEITRGNHSAASAFAKLQKENLANPRPGWLYVFFRASHPPLGDRIDFCNDYHPWTSGIPGLYESKFKPLSR
jgi:Zn-dependent protease with chaperone function